MQFCTICDAELITHEQHQRGTCDRCRDEEHLREQRFEAQRMGGR